MRISFSQIHFQFEKNKKDVKKLVTTKKAGC